MTICLLSLAARATVIDNYNIYMETVHTDEKTLYHAEPKYMYRIKT